MAVPGEISWPPMGRTRCPLTPPEIEVRGRANRWLDRERAPGGCMARRARKLVVGLLATSPTPPGAAWCARAGSPIGAASKAIRSRVLPQHVVFADRGALRSCICAEDSGMAAGASVAAVRQAGDGVRRGDDGLLEQSVEQQPAASRGPAVEAEGVLVEVGLQVARADRALVGAEQQRLSSLATRWTAGTTTCAGLPPPSSATFSRV